MVEVTNYGLIGLAAILVAAFYCAYVDEAPALGTNKLRTIVKAKPGDERDSVRYASDDREGKATAWQRCMG
jgi:hypothetical protein